MSTTMPSASSSARRKVASTTKVAPCRCCAGPKTAPRKLWAIIMWSRTVTLYTGSLPVIRDEVTQRGQGARGQSGEHAGQLLEPRLAGDQRVERGIPEQVEREREPV